MLKSVFMTMALIISVTSYSYYRDRIPNGHHVKHPCKANYMWYGVGHENAQGGGVRNSFGEDFAKYGHEWNHCLCEEDSDGDGMTNGEELGDPNCIWSPGTQPERITDITHPGVCKPLDSNHCQQYNQFLDCDTNDPEFHCDAIHEPGVKNVSLHLTETVVPANETTYICQAFNLTAQIDSHIIAVLQELDNRNVMHHYSVYGCKPDKVNSAWELYANPTQCEMLVCPDVIGFWSLGTNGLCFDEQFGFKIGPNGYQAIILEFHWNNPELRSDYTDSSGVTLYYTENLRAYNGAVLSASPAFIHVPPGYTSYKNIGGCSGECTEAMFENTTIYISYLLPHMHYLGRSFLFEHIRDGQTIREINIERYFYDSPEVKYFEPPIEVHRGDELKVTCEFESSAQQHFTYWGLETKDEMCFAIFIFYPDVFSQNQAVGTCFTTNGYGICGNNTAGNISDHCDIDHYYEVLINSDIFEKCDDTGLECKPGCAEALVPLITHPCLTTPVAEAVKSGLQWSKEHHTMLNMIASCDPKPDPPVIVIPGDGINEACPAPVCDSVLCTASLHNYSILSLGMTLIIISIVAI